MRPFLAAVALLTVVTLVPPTGTHAASFDCARAATPDERAVCADPHLSELDTDLGQAHAQAQRSSDADPDDGPKLLAAGRAFLADRRDRVPACGVGAPVAMLLGEVEPRVRLPRAAS